MMKAIYDGKVFEVEEIDFRNDAITLWREGEAWELNTNLSKVNLLYDREICRDMNGLPIFIGDKVYSHNLKLELDIVWDKEYTAYIGLSSRGKKFLRWSETKIEKI